MAGGNDYAAYLARIDDRELLGECQVDASTGGGIGTDLKAEVSKRGLRWVGGDLVRDYSRARLDADRSARPLTAIKQYRNVSPSGRASPPSPYQDRRGTGHTHPPGRTRCPKCGV